MPASLAEHLRAMPCAQCGGAIQWPGVMRRGQLRFMSPVFCGEGCARSYSPIELTVAKLAQTEHWLKCPREAVSPERRVELERRNDLFPFPRIPMIRR